MAARKRPQENICMPEALASPLPADLLLEIVARSDTRALVRCAATSKLLRHDILDPSFINRVTRRRGGIVPCCILAYLNTHNDMSDPSQPPLSLVHPTSFLDDHMSPYISRFANDLLGEYFPMTSRGGLVLLRHQELVGDGLSNLCMYDLSAGHRTFLPDPPDFGSIFTQRYVLLTAADGIGCYFMVFFANLNGMADNNTHIIQVQTTTTSTCGTWAPAAMVPESSNFLHQDAIVLHGGVIHWLLQHRGKIITYNVCTMEHGTIMLPAPVTNFEGQLYLGSYYTHDGRELLKLIVCKRFKIHVWYQLPDGDWTPGDVTIDMEEKLRSLDGGISTARFVYTGFRWSGERSNKVLLHINPRGGNISCRDQLIMLDLETKEMLVRQYSSHYSILLEDGVFRVTIFDHDGAEVAKKCGEHPINLMIVREE
ncbi:unnamed protein product [Alopecurus aequalis]